MADMFAVLEWLIQNWLAIYGAFAGTLALILNFLRYRHSVQSKKIALKVELHKHPDHDANLQMLEEADESPWGSGPRAVEVYSVTVRNHGSVDAHLSDVGVFDREGKPHEALAFRPEANSLSLYPVTELSNEVVSARSSKTYHIYREKDEPAFTAVRGYAKDKMGRLWRS
jgi:hypothetical protein